MKNHIFISYKREDSQIAGAVRQALRAEKLNVWWDEELQTGEQWAERIDEALITAEAVVVLWSEESTSSDWVRHEASIGKLRGILTHACIDATEIPPPFQSIQAVDLTDWNNREDHPEFQKLVGSIANIRRNRRSRIFRRISFYLLISALLFIAGYFVDRYINDSDDIEIRDEDGRLNIDVIQELRQKYQDEALAVPKSVLSGEIRTLLSDFKDANVAKLLERGRYDNTMIARGDGAYLSFANDSPDYNHSADIQYQGKILSTGFAGCDYGLFLDLGSNVILSDLFSASENTPLWLPSEKGEAWNFLWNYKPPAGNEPEVRIHQRRADSWEVGNVILTERVPAVLGRTYLLRSILFRDHDVLVAFKVVDVNSDDFSVTLAYRTLKRFTVGSCG